MILTTVIFSGHSDKPEWLSFLKEKGILLNGSQTIFYSHKPVSKPEPSFIYLYFPSFMEEGREVSICSSKIARNSKWSDGFNWQRSKGPLDPVGSCRSNQNAVADVQLDKDGCILIDNDSQNKQHSRCWRKTKSIQYSNLLPGTHSVVLPLPWSEKAKRYSNT